MGRWEISISTCARTGAKVEVKTEFRTEIPSDPFGQASLNDQTPIATKGLLGAMWFGF